MECKKKYRLNWIPSALWWIFKLKKRKQNDRRTCEKREGQSLNAPFLHIYLQFLPLDNVMWNEQNSFKIKANVIFSTKKSENTNEHYLRWFLKFISVAFVPVFCSKVRFRHKYTQRKLEKWSEEKSFKRCGITRFSWLYSLPV